METAGLAFYEVREEHSVKEKEDARQCSDA
jgi:hypothetical protein